MKHYPWAVAAVMAAGVLATLTPASAGGLTACVGAHVSATSGEVATARQNCGVNIYDNMQAGNGNGAGISQHGDRNDARSVQLGNGNVTAVGQRGGSNSAAVGQTGNGNLARLKQLGF